MQLNSSAEERNGHSEDTLFYISLHKKVSMSTLMLTLRELVKLYISQLKRLKYDGYLE